MSMSEHSDVAFLTMAYRPIDTMRAIIGAKQQLHIGKKTIYLLHQKPFPRRMEQYPDITIKQFNVEGKWPQLWYKKLMRFFDACTEEYFVWWDEDDRFENEYVSKALALPLTGCCPLVWNYEMVMVRGNSLNPGRYRSAIGTLAGRVDVARDMARLIKPEGDNAKDCQFRKLLAKRMTIGNHNGMRYYIHHKNSHTTRFTNTGRVKGEDVDA